MSISKEVVQFVCWLKCKYRQKCSSESALFEQLSTVFNKRYNIIPHETLCVFNYFL